MAITKYTEWKKDIFEHKYKILLAFIFFAIAITAFIFSSQYVDETKSVAVPDLILDSIPTIDLSILFVWGGLLVFIIYLAYPLFYEPKKFHYSIGMLSLFFLIRSAFVILTHIKAPVDAVVVNSPTYLQFFNYSNDLFFSGHTGLPFLGFLVFDNKIIKYFMLSASIILAITVLLMHIHYSIDVASAFFITYGIYVLGTPLFDNTSTKIKRYRKKMK